jgi:opacity protein-like surface antigen
VLGVAVPASAQDRHILELSGGYQYMFDVTDAEQFSTGVVGSAGWNVVGSMALVGEFAYSQKTFGGSRRRDGKVYSSMGGVRVGRRLFGQVLIGQLAIRTREEQLLGTLIITRAEFAFQAGAGYDVDLTGNLSIRLSGDYRQPFSGSEDFGRQFRGATSFVVGIGRRSE